MDFIPVAKLDEIPRPGARRWQRGNGQVIAIFRTASDAVYALEDACPHQGGPLSQGIVFGESVACPLHNWCISLETGVACSPDEGAVKRFAVRVVNGVVELSP